MHDRKDFCWSVKKSPPIFTLSSDPVSVASVLESRRCEKEAILSCHNDLTETSKWTDSGGGIFRRWDNFCHWQTRNFPLAQWERRERRCAEYGLLQWGNVILSELWFQTRRREEVQTAKQEFTRRILIQWDVKYTEYQQLGSQTPALQELQQEPSVLEQLCQQFT